MDLGDRLRAGPVDRGSGGVTYQKGICLEILGIDIGGSGIKGAPVDLVRGEVVTDRLRVETPQPSKPDAVAEVVAEIARNFDWKGPIGCTFPAVVMHGTVMTAANVDKSWIGTDGAALFSNATGCSVRLINDADAAGIAEIEFGAARGESGVVLLLTLGTGVGSALFTAGTLLPNTELGHLWFKGDIAERYVADSARKDEDLHWHEWAGRLNEYLGYLDGLFSPDLIVIGGGVSKSHEKFLPKLETRARIEAAQLLNNAGIVGAAIAARDGNGR